METTGTRGEENALQRFYRHNRVPILLLLCAVLVFGILSFFSLDFNLIPHLQYPELIVITHYPNAAPEEIQNLVSIPIEQAALSLQGVKNVDTLSREGLSVARIQYRWGENLDTAHIRLREKMDLLGVFFPREVRRPVIRTYQPSREALAGVSVVAEDMDPRGLYLLCRQDVLPLVEKTEGIARVMLQGGERPELKVLVDPDKLSLYSIGATELREAVREAGSDFPVGYFEEDQHEFLVWINGRIPDHQGFGDIVVRRGRGRPVFLKDLARIEYGSAPKASDVLIDGEPALMLSLVKRPSANLLAVSRRVDRLVAELNRRYQGRISFHKVFDESVYVRESLRNLAAAMGLGILFTVLSVVLFLRNVRVSLLVVLTIPFSMIATFIIMSIGGISVNLLTLGGFCLAVGMIVDNSVIVVTGSLGSARDRDGSGGGDKCARFYGKLSRVIPAIFSATFTTIVVFLPVLFLQGVLKLVFVQLSVVMIVSLLFSLVASVTLVPVALDRLLQRRLPRPRGPGMTERGATHGGIIRERGAPERLYRGILAAGMRRKPLLLGGLAVVVVLGTLCSRGVDKRFMESVPRDHFFLELFVNRQVPFTYTSRLVNQLSRLVQDDHRVNRVIAFVGADTEEVTWNLDGRYAENTALMKVYTLEPGEPVHQVISSLRQKLVHFPGADFVVTVPDNPVQRLISRSHCDVTIKLYDPSPVFLARACGRFFEYLQEKRWAQDVLSSYQLSGSRQSLTLRRELLPVYQVDAPSVAQFLTTAISGLQVGAWKKDQYNIPVRVQLQEDTLGSMRDVLELTLQNREGGRIRLGDLVSLRTDQVPNRILRENQRTYAAVEYNLKTAGPGLAGFLARRARHQEVFAYLRGQGLSFSYTDQFTLLRENLAELLIALFLALFLEYVILASSFKSFSTPLLVILMVPLSIPGILLILFLTGSSLNLNTFMSIIVLTGLLVNNAIMLFLEYQERGAAGDDAVVEASVHRLRPILVTTVSTVLALAPLLFTGNRIQVTLAATLMLGLVYATGATLLFLPLLYSMFFLRNGKRRASP